MKKLTYLAMVLVMTCAFMFPAAPPASAGQGFWFCHGFCNDDETYNKEFISAVACILGCMTR